MLEIFTLLNPVIAPDERTTLIESASPVAEFVYVVTGTDVLTCVPDPPQPANTVNVANKDEASIFFIKKILII